MTMGGPGLSSFRRVAVLSVIALLPPLYAGAQVPSKVLGIYAAPTMYEFAEGPAVDKVASGTSLEWAAFYEHPLGRQLGVRVEARYAYRGIVATASNESATASVALYEQFVEFPVTLSSQQWFDAMKHGARLSFAAGLCYAVVVKQEVHPVSGAALPSELDFGEYQRISWLLDGGVALDLETGRAVFARFRLQRDVDTFAESDNVMISPLYLAYGLYAGLEVKF